MGGNLIAFQIEYLACCVQTCSPLIYPVAKQTAIDFPNIASLKQQESKELGEGGMQAGGLYG